MSMLSHKVAELVLPLTGVILRCITKNYPDSFFCEQELLNHVRFSCGNFFIAYSYTTIVCKCRIQLATTSFAYRFLSSVFEVMDYSAITLVLAKHVHGPIQDVIGVTLFPCSSSLYGQLICGRRILPHGQSTGRFIYRGKDRDITELCA